MIIVIHNQATSDERAHLIELLGRMLGTLRPMTVTHLPEQELITLDSSILDAAAQAMLADLMRAHLAGHGVVVALQAATG